MMSLFLTSYIDQKINDLIKNAISRLIACFCFCACVLRWQDLMNEWLQCCCRYDETGSCRYTVLYALCIYVDALSSNRAVSHLSVAQGQSPSACSSNLDCLYVSLCECWQCDAGNSAAWIQSHCDRLKYLGGFVRTLCPIKDTINQLTIWSRHWGVFR